MRKIYNLRLAMIGNQVRLQGECVPGQAFTIYPVYFNSHNGLMYTAKASYIVMSYQDNEFDVDEYIQSQVANVWSDKVGV